MNLALLSPSLLLLFLSQAKVKSIPNPRLEFDNFEPKRGSPKRIDIKVELLKESWGIGVGGSGRGLNITKKFGVSCFSKRGNGG